MSTLRSAALEIAKGLPTGDPTRRKLLGALAATKAAGDGTRKIQIDLDQYGAVFWVNFASYGRVHHITGSLKQWEKNMRVAMDAAREALNDAGIYVEQFDITAYPLGGSDRLMQMEGQIKPASRNWNDQLAEVDALLGTRYKRAPLPKR
jgi:hypothetical protein